MRTRRAFPANESVTHKLTTTKRYVVDITLPPSPSPDALEAYELRFGPTHAEPIVLDKANLSHLIRVLLDVRQRTE